MSEMRLRHRKTRNSDAPKLNEHTHVTIPSFQELNAQDSPTNSLQLKKPKTLKAKSPLDQSKRYAQILCEFVQAVNKGRNSNILDYRDHCDQFKDTNVMIRTQENKEQQNPKGDSEKEIKDYGYVKNLSVVSKQQQKIGKQKFLNKTILSNKKIKKDQPSIQENGKSQIPQALASKPATKNNFETKTPPAPTPANFDKPKPNPIPPQRMPQGPQISPTISLQQLQQYQQLQQMQQMFQNPLYSMNPAMYSMFPYQMMNYQYYMEQLKQNIYAMQGMMGTQSSATNPNPVSYQKLPSPKKQEKQEQKQQPKMQQKKQQKKIARNQQPELKPYTFGQSGNQPIDLKKKSCYHVAISYNIHFGRLKQKGLFANFNSQENLQKLDPTFPAKKIRQKKVTDPANINDST